MEINLKMHTILLLVGPNQCGKTTFVNEIIKPQVEDKVNLRYISSEELRKNILGVNELDEDSAQALEVSGQAFDMLYSLVKMYTSYPVNSELVVVDTKGLSEEFRNDILNIAKENHYNVDVLVFNYKSMGDYYKDVSIGKRKIESQLKRLRLKVLKDLSLRKYNNIHTLTKKDFLENKEDYKVNLVNYKEYKSKFLPEEFDYFIIGDIHERVKEFKLLLEKSGFIIEDNKIVGNKHGEDKRIVLVGDYLDKGGNTKEIIEFIYENKDFIYLVLGNHEDYVNRVLTGESELWEGALNWFQSIPVLQNDEVLRNKFFELLEVTKHEFIIKKPNNSTIYVTHSPCEKKYLGKLDKKSKDLQTRFMINYDNESKDGWDKDLQDQLGWLLKEKDFNEPYHFFGHIATKEIYRVGNRVGIDTGCAYGNRLTGVNVGRGKTYFYSVLSEADKKQELPIIFKQTKRDVNLDELDKEEMRKINYALKNGINYVSGTMSPSDKDLENNVLESLEKGLDYFKDNGVEQVILQPKFMGSRCNLYLYNDLEKTYAVSRNGFKIKHIDLENVFKKQHEKYIDYMNKNDLQLMLLDGELLPWSVLGKGLIEESFRPLGNLVSDELSILEAYGFEEHLSRLLENDKIKEFKTDKNLMNKKDLSEKYGSRDYNTFKSLENYSHVSTSVLEEKLNVYNEQVRIFGDVDVEPYFEPFKILKMEYKNGETVHFKGDMEEEFKFLSDNDYIVIDLKNEESYTKAKEFFETLTVERKMEGVVIKPLIEKNEVLPYMKVRNPEYLTLVYGYDYTLPEKFDKLINQKHIGKKMRTSLKEHNLAKELLETSVKNINTNNKDYMKLLANILLEVREEGNIDPRL